MSDIFPDLDISKIDRINLQRQEPGKRGPGVLVQSGLPSYTDVDEMIGLCEDMGPGKYKAIALDGRGKPLGPAWSWEIAGSVESNDAPTTPQHRPPEVDEELRALRAAHREEIDALRRELHERFEETLERELEQAERRAETKIEIAEMDAEKRVRDVDRLLDDARARAQMDIERARADLSTAKNRIERLELELEDRARQIAAANKSVLELQQKDLESRMTLSTRITELENQIQTQTRIHEAELREIRNGSPKVQSMIAQSMANWEIERSKIMLQSELDDRAREHSLTTKLTEAIKDESVQEVIFPVINHVLEMIAARREQNMAQPEQPVQHVQTVE